MVGIGLLVVVTLAALAYIALTRDNPGKEFGDLGNEHLESEPTNYIWNSRPPTSGPHAPGIAQWGEHDETVPEWQQIHNLEDGGVILHYNCPTECPEILDELRDIMNEVGRDDLILEPYLNMDTKIAVTAWTRLLALDEIDREQIIDFIEVYRGQDHHR
jgi:hypothetical protein